MSYHYTNRLAHLSNFIRGVSFCSTRGKNRDLTTVKHQRIRNCGMLSHKWSICFTPAPSKVKGSLCVTDVRKIISDRDTE